LISFYFVHIGITDLDTHFNPYWIFFISSIAEIVGYVSCKLNDIYGRKKMFMVFLTLIGVSCLVEAIFLTLPESASTNKTENKTDLFKLILKIVFAGLTKAAASAVFDSCYVYNSLFYTTEIRTTAVLFSANVGVVGSFLSPQVRYLGVLVWQPLTYIFYAFNAFASIGVLFLLADPSKMEFK
jgi:MFS family permease